MGYEVCSLVGGSFSSKHLKEFLGETEEMMLKYGKSTYLVNNGIVGLWSFKFTIVCRTTFLKHEKKSEFAEPLFCHRQNHFQGCRLKGCLSLVAISGYA